MAELLSSVSKSAYAENIVIEFTIMAMPSTVGAILVVIGCKPAFSLVSGIIFSVTNTILETNVIAILVAVNHAGHIAFAIVSFGSDRFFLQAILLQGLDNNVPMFTTCNEHGIFLSVDDRLQVMGNQNCNADFNLHGNHPFIVFFVVSANNHREMVIR